MKKKLMFISFLCFAFLSQAQVTDSTTIGTGGGQPTAEDSLMMDVRIKPGSLHKKDIKFLVEAASSSKMEIELGQMAQQKGQSQEVKNYAAMMVKDHTTATQELKSVVSNKGAEIPDTLMPKHRALMDRLSGLEGAAFDKAYMSVMRDAHENDIDEFEDKSKDAIDADVKAFAAKQLPILQGHYNHAKDSKGTMKENMKKEKNNNKKGTSGTSG